MPSWVEETLAKMSLQNKIGQMIWTYVGGKRDVIEQMIKEGQIGALILGPSEMPSPEGAARFTNEMQKLAEIPLLMAADFEAGVGLLVTGATALPNNMAIGATKSPELAYLCGELTAKESRAIGLHMPIAPVVDVNINPENPIINIRSFGESPELVSELAVAWVKGCQDNGAIAVAKHFPGHGDTDIDSHRSMPVIPHNRDRMDKVELKPYRAAISAGLKAIMSAHIHFPAIDPSPGIPATLSHKILTGLLREELGFPGLIVTDAMAMWAIKHNFEMADSTIKAVEAGVDLVLADDPEISYQALLKASKNGRISEERINASVKRILEAKEWLGLNVNRFVEKDKIKELVGTKENQAKALQVARAAITLVKGKEFIDKLSKENKILFLSTKSTRYTGESPNDKLNEMVKMKFPRATALVVEESPSEADLSQAFALAKEAKAAIFSTFVKVTAYREESAKVTENQIKLAEELSKIKPVAVISFGSPYALGKFKTAQALIAAYSDCDACLQATLEVLSGEIEPKGTLPVTVPAI